MKVKEFPIKLILPEPKVIRNPGIHVSGIIRAIAAEMGILNVGAEEVSLVDRREITDPDAILRISIGLAWEEWYISNVLSYLGAIDHPEQIEVDSIHMSLDAESLRVTVTKRQSKYQSVVHEVKATYKSIKRVENLDSQWMWMSQIKAYCKAKATTLAMLHVLFLCDSYKPQLKVWELEFTQQEIEDNWGLLKDYKEQKENG